jgi:hypothetical protein
MRKLAMGVLVVAALAAAAGAWWWQEQRAGGLTPAAAQAPAAATPPIPVELAKVEVAAVRELVTVVGALRSNEAVNVSAEGAGRA